MIVGLAVVALLVAVGIGLMVTLGVRQLRSLELLPPLEGPGPLVSIVVAARNEARAIEAGVGSLLRQSYPSLEIVLVDDRSTDGTTAIVDRLAASDRRIQPVHVETLPPGWIGKNHALWLGSKRAAGDWLLFTDADVVMESDVLSRVMRYALEHRMDHLPVTPRLELPGAVLEAFVVVFMFFFCSYFQPWKAPNPRSRHFVGIGAFNLVRRAAYVAAGTHERIALRPDDDVKLGKILKRNGGRQELLNGGAMMRVEWYHSLGELIVGLEKNAFAGVDYNVPLVVGSVLLQLAVGLGPLVGVIATSGVARWLFLASIGALGVNFAAAADTLRLPRSRALLYPVVIVLFDYILVRTMIKNLAEGGLRWRDTFYPLEQLKANRV